MSATHTPKNRAPKWSRVGAARVRGSGLWIDSDDGRTFGIGAEDLARFIFEGEPATVYQLDPAGAAEPVPVGHIDLSQSGRMVLVELDGEPFTARQMPADHICRHYLRGSRRAVPVVTPPNPREVPA